MLGAVVIAVAGFLLGASSTAQDRPSPSTAQESVAELNQRGAEFFAGNALREAATCFERSLEMNPRQPPVAKLLGLSYQLVQDFDSAERAFHRAADLDEQDGESWFYLGRLYYDQNFFGKAREALRKSLALHSEDHRPHHYLALTLEAQGQIAAAEAEYRTAIHWNEERGKKDFSPQFSFGVLLAKLGRLKEAEPQLLRAVELNPLAWQPHFEVGKLYRRMGDLEAAKKHLKRAISVSTADSDGRSSAYYVLARVYTEMGRSGDAAKALDLRKRE